MVTSFIIGTAGHIDHGKTALVHALTGQDTDRLKEEKRRGISIELGYAPLKLSENLTAGIVDVPGHERLVKTMVMGATQCDLILFVVAANEGMMPQSREHLRVLSHLGARHGIVVLTKKDLVNDAQLKITREKLKEAFCGTFLAEAPIVETSIIKGEGLETLKETIRGVAQDVSAQILAQEREDYFLRVPIDRVFTLPGVGTTVTGPLLYGKISKNDEVEIYPLGLQGRVRELHAYGESREEVLSPSRVAINLKGVSKEQLKRGYVIGRPGELRVTERAYVRLTQVKPFEQGEFTFHTGTQRTVASVQRVESDIFYVKLSQPVVMLAGDRCLLRREMTWAGGEVIDAFPVKRHLWKQKDRREPMSYLLSFFKERPQQPLDRADLLLKTGFSLNSLEKKLKKLSNQIIEVSRSKYLLKEIFDAQQVSKHKKESPEEHKMKRKILSMMESKAVGWLPSDIEEIKGCAMLSKREFADFLQGLIDEKSIIRLPKGFFLLPDQCKKVKERLRAHFESHAELQVSDLKAMFSITRKHAIPYLEFFDHQKWTLRKGNIRQRWQV